MLMREVRDWLHDMPGPITDKAKELGVSYFWLQRFMNGQINNVTTDRLQLLVERMHADQRRQSRQKKLTREARAL